jgi:phosphoketolase
MTVVESTGTATQADAASSPQAGTPDEPQAGDSQETLSVEEARKLRQEHAALRRRLTIAEREANEYRTAGLTELEKLQRENAELKQERTQAQRERKERAIERLLANAQAQYSDLLLSRVNLDDVELDDDGTVRGGDVLATKLKKQYPGLFRVPSADAGASGTPDAGSDINAFIRRQAGR